MGQYLSRTGLIVLLIAIGLKSLVPAGFMPGISSNKMAMTICSGLTLKTVTIPDGPSGHHAPVQHDICPFASPLFAGNDNPFTALDYIKISYAAFLPDPTAHLSLAFIDVKTFYSQGPPENFAV